MFKTKIAITQWIKKNFKNQQDFEGFLKYDYLNGFVQDGRKLLPQHQIEYDALKSKWKTLHKDYGYSFIAKMNVGHLQEYLDSIVENLHKGNESK